MKVGMIFECGPGGPDQKVCTHLTRMLDPNIVVVAVTLTNKPQLIADCGTVAARLLQESCDRVVIVWDLHPGWGSVPCRKEDRAAIADALAAAGASPARVHLVCIEKELEAWLIADHSAIGALLARRHSQPHVPQNRRPEQVAEPKKWLDKTFRENGHGSGYRDYEHAVKIVAELTDFKKIRRCPSFVRFALKVADVDVTR